MSNERDKEVIELDELLYGNPTWEQVVDFWKNGEFCEEKYLVEAIKTHLRTKEHRQMMADMDVSIEEMLNGRYGGDLEPKVFQIYDEWNAKLGFKSFGS